MRLEFEKVDYWYPGSKNRVLDGFSHVFEEGVTILKGYSGCGKSTMLRLASGLLSPREGVVRSDTRSRPGSSAFLREEVGFVFQQLNLLPLASVKRNCELAARLAGQSSKNADHWFKVLGIEDLVKRRPGKLSGGSSSGLRWPGLWPRILRFCYWTSLPPGLDDENTAIIKKVVREQLPEGTTCLIATHDSRLFDLTDAILDFNTSLPA